MHLSQLQDKIKRWHLVKFPGADANDILDKLDEECEELYEAQSHCINERGPEAADVAIALLAYCAHEGIDIESEILKKHAVNVKRVWVKTGEGWTREK